MQPSPILTGRISGGRGWLMYEETHLSLTYVQNEQLTDDSYQAYVDHLDHNLSALTPDVRRAVMYHIGGEQAFVNAARRKAVADVLERHKQIVGQVTTGYAMLSQSSIARGVLTAIFWLAKPPYPTFTTSDPNAAATWLAERTPQLSAQSVMDKHAAALRYGRRHHGL